MEGIKTISSGPEEEVKKILHVRVVSMTKKIAKIGSAVNFWKKTAAQEEGLVAEDHGLVEGGHAVAVIRSVCGNKECSSADRNVSSSSTSDLTQLTSRESRLRNNLLLNKGDLSAAHESERERMIVAKDLLVMGDYLKFPRKVVSGGGGGGDDFGTHPPEHRIMLGCDELKNDENSCHLTFTNVRTSPVSGTPFLLSNISGEVRPGEVLAVMGSTGSGKTSLLNALSGRLPVQGGKIRLNGEDLCKRLRRSKIGYVLQHDVFFADLTLKQTLVYTALLRLPDRKFTKAEKLEKVEEIIDILDLRRCQDTIIGDVMKRGLSGGEKKRLSIACELITNPSVLLIDEPTSGLDSCTASHLMIMLKDFALKESKSVVLAVHQPSSKIFHLFDRLLLLADGQTAYFGQSSHVISHFSALGLHIVPHYNPADFVLEQLKNEKVKILAAWKSKNTNGGYPYIQNGGVISSGEKKQELNEDYNGNEMLRHSSESSLSTWPTSFVTQTRVLAARNFREQLPKMLSAFNWFQTITLAVMAGLTWFKTERNEESLSDLEGFMFFTTNYWMLFALFTPLSTFPSERAVIEKERLSGAYRLSAYYVAKMIGEAPLVVVLPSVYLAVAYPLRGGSVVPFFGLLFVQMLASLAAQSVGLFFGAALNPSASITASALFTLAAQLLGGYLAKTIPPYTKTLSLVYHGYRNMQIFEYLVGDQIVCAKQASEYAACPSFVGTAGRAILGGLQNGTAAIVGGSTNLTAITTDTFIPTQDLLGKDDLTWLPYWSSTVFLIAFFIFFRVLGYIALRRSL